MLRSSMARVRIICRKMVRASSADITSRSVRITAGAAIQRDRRDVPLSISGGSSLLSAIVYYTPFLNGLRDEVRKMNKRNLVVLFIRQVELFTYLISSTRCRKSS